MKQIPLTKIGFFNPGRLTDEEIEQMFITRVPFFEHLFKKIIAETPGSIPQHYLIIGQRGMGKTSLLVRIAAELRKKPYNDSFIALTFPEEQYNVDRLSKFWLNCMDALADALDKENNKEYLPALDDEIKSLSGKNDKEAIQIFKSFKNWTEKIKRRPVLLVDNLNLIFNKIDKDEQHQLRAVLMDKGAPVLVGASTTTIEETVDYGAPFYDAFQISYLKKLSFDESLDVLKNLARITGNQDFETNIYQHKGRLEALYQLTGGTPRTLAILFPLIQGGFSESIQTDLDAILDAVTPLYKARFEELAPQLQVVLDAVALNWDPANLEQLRTITKLDNAQLSPQLKRLVDVGWLQKLDAYKAKGGAYELSERFFNIWYLMRRSSRRQKRELYCLTKFLEAFYGNDLHEIAKGRVNSKCDNINHVALDLALADAIKDNFLSTQLKDKSYKMIFDINEKEGNIVKQFSIPVEVIEKRIQDLWDEADSYFEKGLYKEAEERLLSIIKINNNLGNVWYNLGLLYFGYLFNEQKALESFENAIQFGVVIKDPLIWCGIGSLYMGIKGDFLLAEGALKKAIGINEHNSLAWGGLGILYHNYIKNFNEAEYAYKKSLNLKEDTSYIWNNLGVLYQDHLGKFEEAEAAYKKAIEFDQVQFFPKYNLIFLWRDKMNKIKEAKEFFNSFEKEENPSDSHYLVESSFAFYDKNIGVAESFLQKAINTIKDSALNKDTEDDWYKFATAIIKLGYGDSILKVFTQNEWSIIMRPFYVAIKALTNKDEELFLNSIAAEVREPAKIIMNLMKKYMK
jgi:tetratricopeptide (TPR) repeat protein